MPPISSPQGTLALPTRAATTPFTTWISSPEGVLPPEGTPLPPGIPTDTPTSQP
jgi:hypothetical protein